jgi:pyruvate kinase
MHTSPSIIFTMGPSTAHDDVLTAILAHDISYVRFNMSHASHDEHLERLHLLRRIAASLNKEVKIFADLCGPKIRVLKLKNDSLELHTGSLVRIVLPTDQSDQGLFFSTSYTDLYKYVTPGTKIALDDGKILLSVTSVALDKEEITCEVVCGGTLLSEKGVNVIDTDLPISAFTEKDRVDALFAIENNFDGISLSFVKKKEDIDTLKTFLQENSPGKNFTLIAKIETKQALHAIDEILSVVDIIMIARGDLGIEIPIEEIPIVQKELAYLARTKGVPVIVATEILKSMTQSPFPTRAEITDSINALLDGASYLMLSDETTTGKYPKEAVETLASAINEFVTHHSKYTPFEPTHS